MISIMLALPFTIRQLQVFATLCEVLSFRECAEKLGISQASVSNQVALLEQQLGFRLFARSPGRRPTLTSQGLAFRADLATFDQAGRALAAHRTPERSDLKPTRFRVRIGTALFENFVRPKLSRFLADNPLIECEFQDQLPVYSFDREMLRAGTDFALFHHHPDFPLDRECKPFARVRSGIYGDPKLAGDSGESLTPERISQLPFIMPGAGSPRERQTLDGLADRGIFPRNIICHTEYFDVTVAMVEGGIGVASLPESLLSPSARARIACLYPISDWLLVFYRGPEAPEPAADRVEAFLTESVLHDPDFPTIETYV